MGVAMQLLGPIAILAGAGPLPVPPSEDVKVATASTEDSARMQSALELVKATYPAERARAASLASYEASFRQSFLADPRNAAVANKHPGLLDAMAAAGRSEMSKITDEIEPTILIAIAKDVAKTMSLDDLRDTLAFYRSDAGKAFLTLDPATMNSDGTVPIASLSLDHRRAIGRYQQTGAGQRAQAATAQALARVPTVVAQIFPPYQPRLNARMTEVGNAFIAARSRK